MDDEYLLRYSRQILLPEVGAEGQERLRAARVLIVGAGGLGSPAALYLAAAGVGEITICDYDRVELSNLQRQILHRTADLGRPKAESAREALTALEPALRVRAIGERLEGAALAAECARADVVLDASDNFPTREAVNAACAAAGTPLVSGAAIRFEGQVAVFDPARGGPCYRCLYRDGAHTEETCSESGVIAPLVGIVGSVQALEALKLLLGIGETLAGRLLLLDGLRMEWREVRLPRDPACPVCGEEGRERAGAGA